MDVTIKIRIFLLAKLDKKKKKNKERKGGYISTSGWGWLDYRGGTIKN